MPSTFRVVVADDTEDRDFLKALWKATHDEVSGSLVEIIWVSRLIPTHRCEAKIILGNGREVPFPLDKWNPSVISDADALILDEDMPGDVSAWMQALGIDSTAVNVDPFVALHDGNKVRLTASSFLKLCKGKLKAHPIVILSQWANDPALISHFDEVYKELRVSVYQKDRASQDNVIDQVSARYRSAKDGFTLLQNPEAIADAAHHDEPVLIVGESGTGKEGIAHWIHDRWRQELIRKRPQLADIIPRSPVVVNCPGLAPLLARSELFGHVKGSFTGADQHKIGALLTACGCKLEPEVRPPVERDLKRMLENQEKVSAALRELEQVTEPNLRGEFVQREILPVIYEVLCGKEDALSMLKMVEGLTQKYKVAAGNESSPEDYKRRLIEMNPHRFRQDDGNDIAFNHDGPFGTVFLDEFGDLPIDVQTLLLRYLERFEIQPYAFPWVIRSAKVRIIAATSDPWVAAFGGVTLIGPPRSKQEHRFDLLSRVKGQVIQAERVTKENAGRYVTELTRESLVPWTQKAKQALIDKVIALLDKIGKQDANVQVLSVFGHKRELVRIVKLVHAYVSSTKERGARRDYPLQVEPSDIERVWTPSVVESPTYLSGQPGTQPSREAPDSPLVDLRGLTVPDPKNAREWLVNTVVERLLKNPNEESVYIDKLDIHAANDLREKPYDKGTLRTSLSGTTVKTIFRDLIELGYNVESKKTRVVVTRRPKTQV